MSQAILLILLAACSEKELPNNRSNNGDSGNNEPSDEISCPDAWTEGEDGIWLDPFACAAWSPASDTITWHEAVSSAEATQGGCDSVCDEDTASNYCSDLTIGGYSNWRVPDIAEIESLATREPPFESIIHDLWSLNSDSMDNLAWTANIDQPGMSVLLEKSSAANVRCIAD